MGRLVELVLNIAESRYRAYLNGEPDPYSCRRPTSPNHLTSATFEHPELIGAHHEHHRSRIHG